MDDHLGGLRNLVDGLSTIDRAAGAVPDAHDAVVACQDLSSDQRLICLHLFDLIHHHRQSSTATEMLEPVANVTCLLRSESLQHDARVSSGNRKLNPCL